MTDTDVVPSTGSTRPAPSVAPWLLTTYRLFAYVTGVLLLVNSVFFVVFLDNPEPPLWYAISWTTHGWAYMVYFATSAALAYTMRWPLGRSLLVVMAGLIPGASFVAERWVVRNVVVAGRTQAPGLGQTPRR
jgi:integral membrane protein